MNRPDLRVVHGCGESGDDLYTIADVAKACGLPQPVVAQLAPRTWTDDGWMYTAAQLQAAVDITAGARYRRRNDSFNPGGSGVEV